MLRLSLTMASGRFAVVASLVSGMRRGVMLAHAPIHNQRSGKCASLALNLKRQARTLTRRRVLSPEKPAADELAVEAASAHKTAARRHLHHVEESWHVGVSGE